MYQRSSTTILSVGKGILGMVPGTFGMRSSARVGLTHRLAKDWEGIPIEDADRLRHSLPHLFSRFVQKRLNPMLAELDK